MVVILNTLPTKGPRCKNMEILNQYFDIAGRCSQPMPRIVGTKLSYGPVWYAQGWLWVKMAGGRGTYENVQFPDKYSFKVPKKNDDIYSSGATFSEQTPS